MKQLYLDLECIPNLDAAAIAEIADSITAPGNYKKEDSIKEWLSENRQRMVDEQVHKACFDGATGKIICIGWAWENDPVKCNTGDEKQLIEILFDDISASKVPVTVVGHNVGWDVRYIWQRAVVHGINPPRQIKWQGKPWDYQCTMLLWNPDSQRRISLDRLCKALGVPTSKGDLDGSKVWQAYQDGRIAKIAEYCQRDVEATRQCYQRMTFVNKEATSRTIER